MRRGHRHHDKGDLRFTGEQGDRRRGCALVRQVGDAGTGFDAQHFHCHMRHRAGSGRGIIQRIGLALGQCDKVFYAFHRQRGMRDQHKGVRRSHRDRREVLHRIKGQFFIDRRADRDRRVGEKNRIAVCGGL